MKEKLTASQMISLSFMLFAIFFGAGNMIFPPALGQQAGDKYLWGIMGFVATDVGISLLGIMAVVRVGSTLEDLAGRIGPRFSVGFSLLIYLMLGPLFAMPRTGAVSFELAMLPFLGALPVSPGMGSLLFTLAFFGCSIFLSLNPSKVVDIVGKVLTPILLLAIGALTVASILHPLGAIVPTTGPYAEIPFFKGLVEGYLALDGFASLIFAGIVINSMKGYGITDKKLLQKNTFWVGLIASAALALVYVALGYIGASCSSLPLFENGGRLLTMGARQLFGPYGQMILGLAVLFACLTTSIGLTTSFAEYFHKAFPRFTYRQVVVAVNLFSFAVSNVGLSTMIYYTLPVLVTLYPAVVVMIVLSYFHDAFGGRKPVYLCGMGFALAVGGISGLESLKITLGPITALAKMLPFYDLGVGWILPAIAGCLLGLLIPAKQEG